MKDQELKDILKKYNVHATRTPLRLVKKELKRLNINDDISIASIDNNRIILHKNVAIAILKCFAIKQ